ncbi:MAG: sulfotransferase, partial [Actinobacteria bacterium]|nr:sulfotransferase [Actinomycetota bacterium]
MEQWTPVAIGGAGGSGTRVPARILREAGVYMGADLNRSEDNLWFTLLLKRPRWLPERLDGAHPEVVQGISILERAMAGRLAPTPADLSFVSRATAEIYRHGHDVSGGGRGRWALGRAATLLASRRRAPRRPFCWGWKEPSTHLVLEALHAHFGWRIRYVHVMRHGLDVAAGARPGEVDPWARAIGEDPGAEPIPFPLAALRYWTAANERAIRLGRELLGDRFLLVRLEDLCASPRESVEELLAFAGVEVPAATLD